MQIAIVLYRGLTAMEAIGSYEVLRLLPDAEVRFVAVSPGPVLADSGVLSATATGHPSKASKTVVGTAKSLGRKIALNSSEMPTVPTIAWRRVLDNLRKRGLKGVPR
jgi:hypothetical protein